MEPSLGEKNAPPDGPLATEDRKNLETSFACSASMTTVFLLLFLLPLPGRARDRLTYITTPGPWHEDGYTRRTYIYIGYVKPYYVVHGGHVSAAARCCRILCVRGVPRPRNEDGDDRLTPVSSQANLISGRRFCNNNKSNNNSNSYNGNNNWPPMTSYLFEIKTGRTRHTRRRKRRVSVSLRG